MHDLQLELETLCYGRKLELSTKYVYIVDIDVVLADVFSERNAKSQRTLRPGWVTQFSNAQLTNIWRADVTAPYIFDRDMWLIDGQHRIESVLKTGGDLVLKEQTIWVLKESATTLAIPVDAGHQRTIKDYLRGTEVAVPANIIAGLIHDHSNFNGHTRSKLTRQESSNIIVSHPFREKIASIPRVHRAPAGVVAGIARILRETPADTHAEVLAFFTHVLENNHEFHGSINEHIKNLTTWLHNCRKQATDDPVAAARRTVLTWNAHRAGLAPFTRVYNTRKIEEIAIVS